MRTLVSLLFLFIISVTCRAVLAGQPEDPKAETPCPMKDARIEVQDTAEGVQITIAAENPGDILEIQMHMAVKKKQLDKGLACGCPKVKCEGTVCEKPKCACGEQGQPGPDGRVCDCGCGQEKQEAKLADPGVTDARIPAPTTPDVARPDVPSPDPTKPEVGADDMQKHAHGPFTLCGLEGAKMKVENTLAGVIVNVMGPDPAKIQQRFEKFGTKVKRKPEEKGPNPEGGMGVDEKGPGKGAGKGGDLDSKCKKECEKAKKGKKDKKKTKCDCGN